MPLSKRLEAHLDRTAAIADKATAMEQLAGWMTRNLRLGGRKYSFEDHECHEAIASDQHPSKCVKKCAQVGITELSLRIAAAIMAVTRATIIYVFPSKTVSERFSATRFLPIIQQSPILAQDLSREVNSNAARQVGNSVIYFQGASGTNQAISIPATHLIIDEEDFCDPVILGQFHSRLGHNVPDPITKLQGFKQRFSTPTVSNYGVSRQFDFSDQKHYMVQCTKCNEWQAPSFFYDYVIPGYDNEMAKFDKIDLFNTDYRVEEAYVKCCKCGKDLWQDLSNPAQRQWVAKYPDRFLLSGYQVAPIDVPKYNPVPTVIKKIGEYTIQDHRNFVLGLEYEDKHNSFLPSIFTSKTDAIAMSMEEARESTLSGIRFGIDIGKVVHLLIGRRRNANTKDIDIVLAITLSITRGNLAEQIQEYIDAFRPDTVVLDAGPDFSTPQSLIAKNRYGKVYGCEYFHSVPGAYTHIKPMPDDGLVKADRSGTLTDTMRHHNDGYFHYPKGVEEVEVIKDHLSVTKRITKPGEMGEVVVFPKPDKPDHYAHALNYLYIADQIASDHDILPRILGVPAGVSVIRIGSNNPNA